MTYSRIQPVGDHILIQHRVEKEQTQGGLIIPDSAKTKSQEATVIALGSGQKDENAHVTPFEVKVGDRVLVGLYGGSEVTLEEQKYTVVRAADVLAVLT